MTIILITLIAFVCVFLCLGKSPKKAQLIALSLAAIISFLSYVWVGHPDLPPFKETPEIVTMRQTAQSLNNTEFDLTRALNADPKNLDIRVDLIALRLAQSRMGSHTDDLITQGEDQAPNDTRIKKLREVYEALRQN